MEGDSAHGLPLFVRGVVGLMDLDGMDGKGRHVDHTPRGPQTATVPLSQWFQTSSPPRLCVPPLAVLPVLGCAGRR